MAVVGGGKCRFDTESSTVNINEKRKLVRLCGGFGSVNPSRDGGFRRDDDVFGLNAG